MPLYVYECKACGHVFEDLVKYLDKDNVQNCKICGEEATRQAATTFGVHTKINPRKDTVLTNKEIDKVVGADAEKKWMKFDERWHKKYEARQKKRWGDKTPEPVSIPKDSDGKYSPIMHLGDKKDREARREFSVALKEHREERKKKGLAQFDGPGVIAQ